MLRRILDEIADCFVVSFAFWTLLYCLGLATQWSLHPSGWLWLVFTVVLLAWRLTRRAPGDETEPPGEEARVPHPLGDRLLLVGIAATVVAGIGGLIWTPGTFRITWLAAAVAVTALLVGGWLNGRAYVTEAAEPAAPRFPVDLGVVVAMAGCAVASLFIHLPDTDDPYYLNRSVWVAEHGNAALRDTMFSPEVFNSPYGGGIPIASVEALFGVIAHMVGARAGTINYLVAVPVATALSVWAIWRLCRRWAPRRAFLVFAGAIVFLMLSGDSMLGNFWIPRIWQGKVIAVVFLMPLIWAYLTELYEARRPQERLWLYGLLLASGIAFFGLTPTAVVWGPLMFGAVVVAAFLLRSKSLVVGGALMVFGPIASGAAVVLFSEDVGGEDPVVLTARGSFVRILGETTPMVALGLVAVCLAAVVARRGAPRALAAASAAVSIWVFAPGILPLVNAVTGSGPILWRMLYVAPIPVLAGLLLAVPFNVDSRRRAASFAAVAVVLVGFVAGGRPIWSHTGHGGPVTVTSKPEWKVDIEALHDVEAFDKENPTGVVLLPPRRMKVLTMFSTDAFPVVPRDWFIRNIVEPRADRQARRLLQAVAEAKQAMPAPRPVDRALERLDVTEACVFPAPYQADALEILRQAGYGDERRVGQMTCLSRLAQ